MFNFKNININFFAKHLTYQGLNFFLTQRNLLSDRKQEKIRKHLESCNECWDRWNVVRWEQALKKKGIQELQEYLGPGFHKYFDSSLALAWEWKRMSPKTENEINYFYRQTPYYLYNLMVWYESGDRQDYLPIFKEIIDKYKIKSVIDYGCGTGNDGLQLLKMGVEVYFIDFDCPSTRFLKWRLKKQQLDNWHFFDVDDIHSSLPSADMFWAIDVLEHMVDPLSVVKNLSDQTRIFAHHSPFNQVHGGRHPFHFSFEKRKLTRALSQKNFNKECEQPLEVFVR